MNPVNTKTILIIILVLLAGSVFLGSKYFNLQKELRAAKADLEIQKFNERVLDFTKLFIIKVLKAEDEVDFETRLRLENTVRDLNNEEILAQWNKFVNSKNETEAQQEVKNLLETLVNKINVRALPQK